MLSPHHKRHRAHTPVARTSRSPRPSPILPVELWTEILKHVPRAALLFCQLVSRKFYLMASLLVLDTVKLRLDPSFFDGSGSRYSGAIPPAVVAHDTRNQTTQVLQEIIRDRNCAKRVRTVIVYTRDASAAQHFTLTLDAIGRMSNLREFHLVMTEWRDSQGQAEVRPVHRFVQGVLRQQRNLRALTLPPRLAQELFQAVADQPRLRRAFLREDLSSFEAEVHNETRDVVRGEIQALPTHARFGRRLTELCVDECLVRELPRKALRNLQQLEILHVYQHADIARTLKECNALESLTVQETSGYSNAITAYGWQLPPGAQDVFISTVDNPGNRIFKVLADNPQILPKMTSFKYVEYSSILPAQLCALLRHVLSRRRNLERVDLNTVILGQQCARDILQVLAQMPKLTTLGIEVREVRNATGVVGDLLALVPKTVRNLRFAIHGWTLFDEPGRGRTDMRNWIVSTAVKLLPRLRFLHISDGVERPTVRTSSDAVTLLPCHLGQLELLGIEFSYFDVRGHERGDVLVPWGPRQVLWNMYETDKMGEDAEWLMRYHRDRNIN